tara:strand:- start:30 stop:506 length:477 start_codon:yes stop_codon:yes gene_type:complete
MTTVYSDVRTDTTQDDPSEFVKANQLAGSLRVARAVFEASALPADDVIEMFALPNGARIVEGFAYFDNLGANTDISVGHAAYVNAAGTTVAADPDEFLGETATTSAGRANVAATLALGANTEVDLDGEDASNEYVVTVTMLNAAGTGTIELVMFYVVD